MTAEDETKSDADYKRRHYWGWKGELKEKLTEVTTLRVEWPCPDCEDGYMVADNMVLTSNPPQYPHACDKCGYMIYSGIYKRYPRIETR